MKVNMIVNGQSVERDVESRTLLVHFIRDELGLTGTHIECETSYCGACTVTLNGAAVKSCTMLAAQAEGGSIVTIEGIADADELHPIQEGFRQRHGLQCGFCTPGVIMSAASPRIWRPGSSSVTSIRAISPWCSAAWGLASRSCEP